MLEGKIERQGFLDIIQLLTMSRKTGRLEIEGAAEANLYFSDGELLDCQMRELAGDTAFIELFILVSGNFQFHEEKIDVKSNISKSLTDLLMAASKQAGEWDKACKELPLQDAALILTPVDPDSDKEFTLNALEWAIISQVNGRRSFPEIARSIKQPKTRIAITVSGLKKTKMITPEDTESALLRTVFRKTSEMLFHLIETRVKERSRERVITEFNRWTFSKGYDIRMLEKVGIVNNITYDLPVDDKRLAYRQILEQLYEGAQSGLNRNELQDHMADLYESLGEEERRVVAESGLSKFLSSSGKKGTKAPDFWDSAEGRVDGLVP